MRIRTMSLIVVLAFGLFAMPLTAKALGLTIPPTVLFQATKVIQ